MEKITHFRCNRCKLIELTDYLVNNPWYGWVADGKVKPVDNHCCPVCDSNNITYRSPGVDG